jgi:radical SAM superfamily enzyme YgiQ (UPF0313 family)
VTGETLAPFRRAGNLRFYCALGVESSDPEILKAMGKRQSSETVARAISLLSEAGLSFGTYLLFGSLGPSSQHPETLETVETAQRSIEFIARLRERYPGLVSVLPGIQAIFPGTRASALYQGSAYNKHTPISFDLVESGHPWDYFEGGMGFHAPGVTEDLAGAIDALGRSLLGDVWEGAIAGAN